MSFSIIYVFLFLSSAMLDSNGFAMPQKLEPIGGKGGMSIGGKGGMSFGGKGGKSWDDGADHDNVAKVYIRGGLEGIQYIKFDYVKNGQSISGSIHGVSGDGFTQTFEIDLQNSEYIVSLDGYYERSGVMQALEFKTNLRSSGVIGYTKGTTKASLGGVKNQMMIGFHGSAGKALNSIGAYTIRALPTKSELVGNLYGGMPWDDGPNYEGVKKIAVTYTSTFIKSIDVDYQKDSQVVTCSHGLKNGITEQFVIDYPNEYLTSVEGTCNYSPTDNYFVVRSIVFKTSKGRISPTYGVVSGDRFVFEKQGQAIVGFHGRDGDAFDAIGVYFSPM